jgi:hypothetical protein
MDQATKSITAARSGGDSCTSPHDDRTPIYTRREPQGKGHPSEPRCRRTIAKSLSTNQQSSSLKEGENSGNYMTRSSHGAQNPDQNPKTNSHNRGLPTKHSPEAMPKPQNETYIARTAAHRKAQYTGRHSHERGYKRERTNASRLHFRSLVTIVYV